MGCLQPFQWWTSTESSRGHPLGSGGDAGPGTHGGDMSKVGLTVRTRRCSCVGWQRDAPWLSFYGGVPALFLELSPSQAISPVVCVGWLG